MSVLESLFHAMDQLDEQLSSGTFTYILTSQANFFAYDQFLWAFVFSLVGVVMPVVLQFTTHNENYSKLDASVRNKDYSKMLAYLYLLMAYILGAIMCLLPEIYMKRVRGSSENEFVQAHSLPNGYSLICSN